MNYLKLLSSIFFIGVFILTGCGVDNNEAIVEDTRRTAHEDGNFPNRTEGLMLRSYGHARIDVEDNVAPKGYYTKEEARNHVKQHLNIQSTSDANVAFEGYAGGLYIFRVFDTIRLNTNTEEITRGWYSVDPHTGDVMHYKYDTE
ncbi:hypothetical protein ACWE42_06305 [Sutcliffiella cohnii]